MYIDYDGSMRNFYPFTTAIEIAQPVLHSFRSAFMPHG